jgi:hypothetical protein
MTLRAICTLCLFVSASAQPAPPGAREIVQHSIEKNQQDDARLRDYTYNETTVVRTFDRAGAVVKTETRQLEVMNLYGSQYRHLVAKDGHALKGKSKEAADAEYNRELHKREVESEDDRLKREEKAAKDRAEGRKFLAEIPKAYDLKLAGEETLEGLPAWVIEATPRADYRPGAKHAELLRKLRGRLWIDKASEQWVKVEAEVIAPITFGGFLAKVDQGAKLTFLATRIDAGLWVPSKVTVRADARVLFKHASLDVETAYTDYQRFRVESKMVPAEEAPAR